MTYFVNVSYKKTSFSKIYLKTEVVLLSRAVIDESLPENKNRTGRTTRNEKRKISRDFMRKKKEEEEEEEEENRGVSQ